MQIVNQIKRCIIITGMSGAGKSTALNVFEDQGFYAIDNLPPLLLPQLLDVLEKNTAALEYGVAAVVDVRSRELFNDLIKVVALLRKNNISVEVIFVDASNETLIRRFETTRRRHPLAEGVTILKGIESERVLLSKIAEIADKVIDTTSIKLPSFRTTLLSQMSISVQNPSIIMSSFGFKYGLPQDADYVIDVRFLPNPNYIDTLQSLSGNDSEVKKYIKSAQCFDDFITKTEAFLGFIASKYNETGKKQLHICIGCTGGRHRSVAVTEILGEYLKDNSFNVSILHRDIEKGNEN